MAKRSEDPSDWKHLADVTMRTLIVFMVQMALDLALIILTCFLGTTLLILALERL